MPFRRIALCAALLSATTPVLADNLLQKAHFDDSSSFSAPWTWENYPGAAAAWADSPDHSGTGSSGSVHVAFTGNSSIAGVLRQCVVVAPNTNYVFGFWEWLTSGSNVIAGQVDWFASGDCSGESLGASGFNGTPTQGAWTLVNGAATSAATANSAQLGFYVCFGSCDVDLDDAFFGQPPLTPVGLQGFDVR